MAKKKAAKKKATKKPDEMDEITIFSLRSLVSKVTYTTDPREAEKNWRAIGPALKKAKADPKRSERIQLIRDAKALHNFVEELIAEKTKPVEQPDGETAEKTDPPKASANPADQLKVGAIRKEYAKNEDGTPTDEVLKRAMRSFRKRVKFMKLDDESRLGGAAAHLHKTQESNIVAIQAPELYPKEVWEHLVSLGRLKRAGRGFYQLNE